MYTHTHARTHSLSWEIAARLNPPERATTQFGDLAAARIEGDQSLAMSPAMRASKAPKDQKREQTHKGGGKVLPEWPSTHLYVILLRGERSKARACQHAAYPTIAHFPKTMLQVLQLTS